jgi:predicted metalloprotease with PDZ domain
VGLTTVMPCATLRNDNGRLVVAQVRRGTPVFDAGVNAEDEILAIGGYRVRPDQWEARLEAFKPGEKVPLLVARRERLVTLEVIPATQPPRTGPLEPDPAASDAARARLAGWLKP